MRAGMKLTILLTTFLKVLMMTTPMTVEVSKVSGKGSQTLW